MGGVLRISLQVISDFVKSIFDNVVKVHVDQGRPYRASFHPTELLELSRFTSRGRQL